MIIVTTSMIITTANAGSQQTEQNLYQVEEIVKFSKDVEHFAAQHQAHAFIIGRVGRAQDSLPKGIKFTHTAIAVYSELTLTDGSKAHGYAIHNLYQTPENKNTSFLMTDFPVDFFWGAQMLSAGVVIPTPELQRALINLIKENKHLELHNPKYSVVANPYNDDFQNCTEYTLDMINAAIYQTTEIDRLKSNALHYFQAQPIHMSRFKLALGSAFSDGVTLKDHRGSKVQTATFTSLARYLEKYGLLQSAKVIHKDNTITDLL